MRGAASGNSGHWLEQNVIIRRPASVVWPSVFPISLSRHRKYGPCFSDDIAMNQWSIGYLHLQKIYYYAGKNRRLSIVSIRRLSAVAQRSPKEINDTMRLQTLNTVQVTGWSIGKKDNQLDVAQSVGVLTPEDFHRNTGLSLENSLNLMPGVSMGSPHQFRRTAYHHQGIRQQYQFQRAGRPGPAEQYARNRCYGYDHPG